MSVMSSHNRTQKAVPSLVTLPNSFAQQCLFPHVHATWTDGPSEDLQMGECLIQGFDGPRSLRQATTNELTDDALLEIFDFYLNDDDPQDIHKWHTLPRSRRLFTRR